MRSQISVLVIGLMLLVHPAAGFSWGSEGHEIVALTAQHYLNPAVRAKLATLRPARMRAPTRMGMANSRSTQATRPTPK